MSLKNNDFHLYLSTSYKEVDKSYLRYDTAKIERVNE